jgi:murein DD-endopeptidase MepM/ murein hydrolase activator NlpD
MTKLLILFCCCLPLRHLSLTSTYGYRVHPLTGKIRFHSGIDLRARADTVFAVMAGHVDFVGYNEFLGVHIRVVSSDFTFLYGHLSQVFVLPGDAVAEGMPIAISGSTGRVTGEHLHFSVAYRQVPVNPLLFLSDLMKNLNKNK